MKSININEQLLEMQKKWFEEFCNDELAKQHNLSRPFCFSVTEQYLLSNNKAMLIGQEPLDLKKYSGDWSIDGNHMFSKEYAEIQLNYKNPNEDILYNNSPFWRFFRGIKDKGWEPIWNNVDKIHRYENDKTKSLTIDLERRFSSPYGSDNKSLLKREIEVSKPNLVIFLTGPSYYKTMAWAMGIDCDELLKFKPQKKNPCTDITHIVDIGIPVLWSYHPAYLSRIKAMDEVYDMCK